MVGEFLRFLVLGSLNTVATFGLLIALTRVVEPTVAFTIAFAVGVLANTLTTGRVVFSTRPTRRRNSAYACWLLVVYCTGLLVIHVMTLLNLPDWMTASAPLLVTAPLSFIGGRTLLRPRQHPKEA